MCPATISRHIEYARTRDISVPPMPLFIFRWLFMLSTEIKSMPSTNKCIQLGICRAFHEHSLAVVDGNGEMLLTSSPKTYQTHTYMHERCACVRVYVCMWGFISKSVISWVNMHNFLMREPATPRCQMFTIDFSSQCSQERTRVETLKPSSNIEKKRQQKKKQQQEKKTLNMHWKYANNEMEIWILILYRSSYWADAMFSSIWDVVLRIWRGCEKKNLGEKCQKVTTVKLSKTNTDEFRAYTNLYTKVNTCILFFVYVVAYNTQTLK